MHTHDPGHSFKKQVLILQLQFASGVFLERALIGWCLTVMEGLNHWQRERLFTSI